MMIARIKCDMLSDRYSLVAARRVLKPYNRFMANTSTVKEIKLDQNTTGRSETCDD